MIVLIVLILRGGRSWTEVPCTCWADTCWADTFFDLDFGVWIWILDFGGLDFGRDMATWLGLRWWAWRTLRLNIEIGNELHFRPQVFIFGVWILEGLESRMVWDSVGNPLLKLILDPGVWGFSNAIPRVPLCKLGGCCSSQVSLQKVQPTGRSLTTLTSYLHRSWISQNGVWIVKKYLKKVGEVWVWGFWKVPVWHLLSCSGCRLYINFWRQHSSSFCHLASSENGERGRCQSTYGCIPSINLDMSFPVHERHGVWFLMWGSVGAFGSPLWSIELW